MVRRALAMATGEQYLRLAFQFALIVVVSRLLTPAEIGVSVIGTGIMAIVLGLREFATSDFLIQRQEIGRDDIRTSFTVVFVLTALITVAVFVLAPWIGTFYGEDKLALFLRIAAIGGLIEAISLPIRGLLRRDMAFGTLAFINTSAIMMTAGVTILLALLGFSFMSFAWGMLAANCATCFLSFYSRPDFSILRPSFRSWGTVLAFGGYNGASFVINQAYEALPQLVLGRILPYSAVGLYNRAHMVSAVPNQTILMGVFTVAFPALAAEVRQGRSVKEPYLRALSLITVFYWPAQVLIALLAYPIVSLVLGQQWLEVAPLLQLMAVAGLAWFPVMLTPPVLLAVGANRDRVMADLIGRSVSAVVLCAAAWFGIMAMAASKLLTLPFQMILSLGFVRRHVPFWWRELWVGALWRSAVVTAGSAVGPVVVIVLSGAGFELSIAAMAVAVLLAACGWLASVLVTRHTVVLELTKALETIVETALVQRLRARLIAPGPRAGEVR